MARIFMYNQMPLEDPDPEATPEEVKYIYAAAYSELVNAQIQGPHEEEGNQIYTFTKIAGTKGTDQNNDHTDQTTQSNNKTINYDPDSTTIIATRIALSILIGPPAQPPKDTIGLI